jgi:hypothetical protein
LDSETVQTINDKGGLKAIVISHPHYYTTHLDWAREFDCPVYIAAEDEEWCSIPDKEGRRTLIKGTKEEVVPGVVVAKPGGHFPGSLVTCWEKKLFIADTLLTVPVCFQSTICCNRANDLISRRFIISIGCLGRIVMRLCGVYPISSPCHRRRSSRCGKFSRR